MPSSDVMAAFLDEAAILTELGVVLGAMETLEMAESAVEYRKRARDPARYAEIWQAFAERSEELLGRVVAMEVVQPELIQHHLGAHVLAAAL